MGRRGQGETVIGGIRASLGVGMDVRGLQRQVSRLGRDESVTGQGAGEMVKAKGSGCTLIHVHLNSRFLALIRCARQKVRPDPVFGRPGGFAMITGQAPPGLPRE
jgi:hypothetical protein